MKNFIVIVVSVFGCLDGMVINYSVFEFICMSDEIVENFKCVYDVNVFSCFVVVSIDICVVFEILLIVEIRFKLV